MYKKMLVPLDGSQITEIVLPYARELAGRLDLELTLLHVCEPHRSESQFVCQAYIEHVAEMLEKQAREVQAKTGAPQEAKAVEAHVEVAVGYPAERILGYAEENEVDLILMATHGRSGVRRWVLGSVVDKVLRASNVPVWLVRADVPEEIVHDKWPERTMLVPLDGSKFAESVLPHVETLAKQRGADLVNIVLLRVFAEPYVNADYPESTMNLTWQEHVARIRKHFKQEAAQYLAEVQKRLSNTGLKVRSEVLMGNPAHEIIRYAHKNRPNLVVMATHGSSGVSPWEYGDTADKVLHGISSPVLLVRSQ
jgi:nucleotide-binding universal stress UspA family protein